ncbi:MAG: hypothetical protein LBD59_09200 [Prevotellaceae bacterium]|nr:hypothetical protein [Prevotellaceae bacterium]
MSSKTGIIPVRNRNIAVNYGNIVVGERKVEVGDRNKKVETGKIASAEVDDSVIDEGYISNIK